MCMCVMHGKNTKIALAIKCEIKIRIEKRKQNCKVDFTSLSKVFEIHWH